MLSGTKAHHLFNETHCTLEAETKVEKNGAKKHKHTFPLQIQAAFSII